MPKARGRFLPGRSGSPLPSALIPIERLVGPLGQPPEAPIAVENHCKFSILAYS